MSCFFSVFVSCRQLLYKWRWCVSSVATCWPSLQWQRWQINGLMKLLSLQSGGWINSALLITAAPKSLPFGRPETQGTTAPIHSTHMQQAHTHTHAGSATKHKKLRFLLIAVIYFSVCYECSYSFFLKTLLERKHFFNNIPHPPILLQSAFYLILTHIQLQFKNVAQGYSDKL